MALFIANCQKWMPLCNMRIARIKCLQQISKQLFVRPQWFLEEAFERAPAKAGIYGIWKGETLEYVGETGNLKKRIGDLRDTRNHTFRHSIGKAYKERTDFDMGSTSIKFDKATERSEVVPRSETHS